ASLKKGAEQVGMVTPAFPVLVTHADTPQPAAPNNSSPRNATWSVVTSCASPALTRLSTEAAETPNTPKPALNQAHPPDSGSSQPPLAFAARLEEVSRVETPPSKAVGEPTTKPQFAGTAKLESPSKPDAGLSIVSPTSSAKEADLPNRRILYAAAPDRVVEPK